MAYITRLYEKDENGKFWPAGSVAWSSLKRAKQNLDFHTTEEGGISGLILRDNAYIVGYKGMTEAEALRVSPVKLLAIGR